MTTQSVVETAFGRPTKGSERPCTVAPTRGHPMPVYMKLGDLPRKGHKKLARAPRESSKGGGTAYEPVAPPAGFDRAYSIPYPPRPPTRVKRVEHAGTVELTGVE